MICGRFLPGLATYNAKGSLIFCVPCMIRNGFLEVFAVLLTAISADICMDTALTSLCAIDPIFFV